MGGVSGDLMLSAVTSTLWQGGETSRVDALFSKPNQLILTLDQNQALRVIVAMTTCLLVLLFV